MKAIRILAAMILATTLTNSLVFAKDTKKTDAKSATSATLLKMPVTGQIKWTGYGVGKEHRGSIQVKTGEIEMKGNDPVKGKILFDMPSLTTPDSDRLQGHLRSPDFFDVVKFPEATYEIKSVEVIQNPLAGQPTHKLNGDLTIKEKTQPLVTMAVIKKEGSGFTAKGTTEIPDRTKYDVVYNSAQFKSLSALGDKMIKDNITIEFDVKTK